MEEKKSYTMAEMAERKFELPFDEIFSFSQLYDLKKTRGRANELWRDHKELFNYLEKARMYALLVGKEELWTEWWEENKFSIGFKILNEFFGQLKYRECAYCGNPFSEGRADKSYCSDNCRNYAFLRKQKEKTTAI